MDEWGEGDAPGLLDFSGLVYFMGIVWHLELSTCTQPTRESRKTLSEHTNVGWNPRRRTRACFQHFIEPGGETIRRSGRRVHPVAASSGSHHGFFFRWSRSVLHTWVPPGLPGVLWEDIWMFFTDVWNFKVEENLKQSTKLEEGQIIFLLFISDFSQPLT